VSDYSYFTGREIMTEITPWLEQPIGSDGTRNVRAEVARLSSSGFVTITKSYGKLKELLVARAQPDEGVSTRDLDAEHDRLGRGIFKHLHSLELLSTDEARREDLRKLRDTLFPQGASIMSRSFVEEAGAAELRAVAVTPAVRAQLAAIAVGTRTLADVFDDFQSVARALGAAVSEGAADAAAARATATDVSKAKSRLIRAIRGLFEQLALDDVPEERIALLSGPLDVAADNARRRSLERAARRAPVAPAGGAPAA
jgi:hypothetical protein